jgi:hypothetical protein
LGIAELLPRISCPGVIALACNPGVDRDPMVWLLVLVLWKPGGGEKSIDI